MKFVEEVLGAGLTLLIVTDVFLTVLYARADSGLIGRQLAHSVFAVFRGVSRMYDTEADKLLSFAGPTILVLLVIVWFFGLALGAALVMHPQFGTAIRASSGHTQTDLRLLCIGMLMCKH